MRSSHALVLFVLMTLATMTDGKKYSAVEQNRNRIARLYANNILTRPSTQNNSQTIVAIGLGIIEVAGLDAQKQVRAQSSRKRAVL